MKASESGMKEGSQAEEEAWEDFTPGSSARKLLILDLSCPASLPVSPSLLVLSQHRLNKGMNPEFEDKDKDWDVAVE